MIESDKVRLRPTTEADIDFVIANEHEPENWLYVGQWTREQIRESFPNPDVAHLIIEALPERRAVGHVIVAGLQNPDHNVEFKRIAMREKGRGYGHETLSLVKKLVFERYKAHRLWLDVVESNQRARHLYKVEGFTEEGTLRECLKYDYGWESLVVMSILEHEYQPKE